MERLGDTRLWSDRFHGGCTKDSDRLEAPLPSLIDRPRVTLEMLIREVLVQRVIMQSRLSLILEAVANKSRNVMIKSIHI